MEIIAIAVSEVVSDLVFVRRPKQRWRIIQFLCWRWSLTCLMEAMAVVRAQRKKERSNRKRRY